MKKFLFVLCAIIIGLSAHAQNFNKEINLNTGFSKTTVNDTIHFTLMPPYYNGYIAIAATNGKQFTIDWGDGSEIETKTGTGNLEEISHNYGYDTIDYTVTITGITADCLFPKLFFHQIFSLIDLDVSACKSLESLTFDECRNIHSLDLSNNKALKYLGCSQMPISSLDLSSNKALTILGCSQTQITSLDLSNNPALMQIDCHRSQINSLDLGNNTALETLYCWESKITSLDLRNNTALVNLWCSNNYISSLELGSNTTLMDLVVCENNQLPLSNLYNIAQKLNNSQQVFLGRQTLPSQTVEINEPVDYSDQKEFGGIATVFTVQKDGVPATSSDYTILDGIFTFKTHGNYKIIMTNAAIGYDTEVVVNFIVPLGISKHPQDEINVIVYPNPTTGELIIENGSLNLIQGKIENVEVFDVYGRKISSHHLIISSSHHKINISHFPAGVYIVKILTEEGVFVKKIIKK